MPFPRDMLKELILEKLDDMGEGLMLVSRNISADTEDLWHRPDLNGPTVAVEPRPPVPIRKVTVTLTLEVRENEDTSWMLEHVSLDGFRSAMVTVAMKDSLKVD